MRKRILSLIFVALLLVTVFPFSVFAQENVDVSENITDLSKTTIEYDFENVFLGAYNVNDYVPNSTKNQKQIITFTEYVNSNGEIELYFYLYNPRQARIYNTGENKISLSYSLGEVKFVDFEKYDIEKIDVKHFSVNTSSETNASLIKYKISGFSLSTSEKLRAYSLGDIELRLKNSVVSEKLGKTFTFNENVDGLIDVTTGGQSVIEIDEIGHTFYRVKNNESNFNDVRTVYFAVDKDIVNQNGLMDSVKVSWQEKELQPMLLLDDKTVLAAFQNILAQNVPSDFKYSFGVGMKESFFKVNKYNIGDVATTFDIGFNTGKFPSKFYSGTDFLFGGYVSNLIWSDYYHILKKSNAFDDTLEKLYFAFYCDYLEESVVSGEDILNAINSYDSRYSDELFLNTEYYTAVYNVKDEIALNKYELSTDIWKYITNGLKFTFEKVGELDVCRFEKFNVANYERALKNGDEYLHNYLSESYLIDKNDVEDFCKFVEKNSEDKYIYFIRYSITDTEIKEAAVFGDTYLSTGSAFLDKIVPLDECYVCNGTLVNTVMINDFDVIQLGFDDLRGGYTVVPVSAVPTDNIPDVSQINKKLPPDKNDNNLFDNILKLLRIIAIVIIVVISTAVVSTIALIVLLLVMIFRKGRRVKK